MVSTRYHRFSLNGAIAKIPRFANRDREREILDRVKLKLNNFVGTTRLLYRCPVDDRFLL